jgi:hypothetical protein
MITIGITINIERAIHRWVHEDVLAKFIAVSIMPIANYYQVVIIGLHRFRGRYMPTRFS